MRKFSYKQSKPKQTNKHEKKNSRKRECGILREIIQIATLQAMAQHQSPNNSSKNCCELANNNKPQHIQQQDL